ncbi:MAG: DUF2232 domain-containing protein, partial [Gemmatimonadales bacterium]
LAIAVLWTAGWLSRTDELTGQFARAFVVVLIGAWLVLLVIRPGRAVQRSLLAVGVALAVTFGWLVALGFQWGDLEAAAARALSDVLLTQAHAIEKLGGGSDLGATMLDVAGQARAMARLFPAGIALAALAGLALAWRGHFWLSARPLGAVPAPFSAFTFSDQVIWLLVAALALVLIPADPWLEPVQQLGTNLLLVVTALYVVRGAAVLRATAGRVSTPFALVAFLIAVLMFVFVAGGLSLLGVADTWLDFRRRAAPANGGVKS